MVQRIAVNYFCKSFNEVSNLRRTEEYFPGPRSDDRGNSGSAKNTGSPKTLPISMVSGVIRPLIKVKQSQETAERLPAGHHEMNSSKRFPQHSFH